MMFLLGILAMVVGLIISVALHELGHLLPAKRFGALVPEYWIGFGPTLWSRKFRGTTYGIKAMLLGGYVRIVGMFPPPSAVAARPNDRGLVADARAQSAEEIAAARERGLTGTPFYRLATWQKLVIMLGGPVMNLFLGFLLTGIVVMGFGWQEPSTTVAQVVPTTSQMSIPGEDAPSPAAEAGILAGDKIVSWDGRPVDSWDDLRDLMQQSDAAGTAVIVERDGKTREFLVTPVATDDGAKIGVVASLERVRGTFADTVSSTGQLITGTGSALIQLPQNLWRLASGIGSDSPRDPNGAISVIGVARLAGEAATVGGTSLSFGDRAAVFFSLLASLNIALFVFNLIPLPPLDGGHVVGAAWGGVRNLWARVRGLPKPPPADTARMVPISYGVFLALVAISLILMAADIVKPLSWG